VFRPYKKKRGRREEKRGREKRERKREKERKRVVNIRFIAVEH